MVKKEKMDKLLKRIFVIIFTLYIIVFIGAQITLSKRSAEYKKNPIKKDELTIEEGIINSELEINKTYKPGEFLPIPKPQPGDWLANYEESGQTLVDFLTQKHNIPDSKRNKIYLFPLEDFSKLSEVPSLSLLKDFTSKYFNMPTEILSSGNILLKKVSKRNNPYSGQKQYHAGEILEEMKNVIPEDAFCVLAITFTDLYPEDSWNFVFGLGSFLERVGVFSFARYYTAEDISSMAESEIIKVRSLFNLRCCKIISHETGHMFGLEHCIDHLCNMNGSNNLREFDGQPIYLCPVCLSKLQKSVNFKISDRYDQLLNFYDNNNFIEEVQWLKARIENIKENRF